MEALTLPLAAIVAGILVNPAAAEWIVRRDGDGNEPWVFVIDDTGTITHRFDNVVNQAVLDTAIQEALV